MKMNKIHFFCIFTKLYISTKTKGAWCYLRYQIMCQINHLRITNPTRFVSGTELLLGDTREENSNKTKLSTFSLQFFLNCLHMSNHV